MAGLLVLALSATLFFAVLSAAQARNTITRNSRAATVAIGGIAAYTIKSDSVNTSNP